MKLYLSLLKFIFFVKKNIIRYTLRQINNNMWSYSFINYILSINIYYDFICNICKSACAYFCFLHLDFHLFFTCSRLVAFFVTRPLTGIKRRINSESWYIAASFCIAVVHIWKFSNRIEAFRSRRATRVPRGLIERLPGTRAGYT